jgi:hypothetical protein
MDSERDPDSDSHHATYQGRAEESSMRMLAQALRALAEEIPRSVRSQQRFSAILVGLASVGIVVASYSMYWAGMRSEERLAVRLAASEERLHVSLSMLPRETALAIQRHERERELEARKQAALDGIAGDSFPIALAFPWDMTTWGETRVDVRATPDATLEPLVVLTSAVDGGLTVTPGATESVVSGSIPAAITTGRSTIYYGCRLTDPNGNLRTWVSCRIVLDAQLVGVEE